MNCRKHRETQQAKDADRLAPKGIAVGCLIRSLGHTDIPLDYMRHNPALGIVKGFALLCQIALGPVIGPECWESELGAERLTYLPGSEKAHLARFLVDGTFVRFRPLEF